MINITRLNVIKYNKSGQIPLKGAESEKRSSWFDFFFYHDMGVLRFSRVQTLVYNDKAVLLLELNLHFSASLSGSCALFTTIFKICPINSRSQAHFQNAVATVQTICTQLTKYYLNTAVK